GVEPPHPLPSSVRHRPALAATLAKRRAASHDLPRFTGSIPARSNDETSDSSRPLSAGKPEQSKVLSGADQPEDRTAASDGAGAIGASLSCSRMTAAASTRRRNGTTGSPGGNSDAAQPNSSSTHRTNAAGAATRRRASFP